MMALLLKKKKKARGPSRPPQKETIIFKKRTLHSKKKKKGKEKEENKNKNKNLLKLNIGKEIRWDWFAGLVPKRTRQIQKEPFAAGEWGRG